MAFDELAREALTHGLIGLGGELAPLLPQTSPPLREEWSELSSLVEGDPGAVAGADVVAAGPDQPVVVVLLDDVGRPARDAARGDDRREEIDRDAERVEERRRVEVDVGD